jgi:hypothetical protein
MLLAVMVLGGGLFARALAADCGDGVGPCSCGDRVVTNSKLDGSDPVLRTTCPCDGLVVASGVALNIGGTIQGSGACTGVRVEENASGGVATDVAITNGRIRGFGWGVRGAPIATTHSRFSRLQLLDNIAEGISIFGDGNIVESNAVQGGSVGIFVTSLGSEGNVVRLNRTEASFAGLVVMGSRNIVSRNVMVGGLYGLWAEGFRFTIDSNRAVRNCVGFHVFFAGGVVSRNVAYDNGHGVQCDQLALHDGFEFAHTSLVVDRNRAVHNAGFGIREFEPNAYTGNLCSGNGAGDSDPPGLCK